MAVVINRGMRLRQGKKKKPGGLGIFPIKTGLKKEINCLYIVPKRLTWSY